jgi:hypothetical protein
MTDLGLWQPSGDVFVHPLPIQASFLASLPERTETGVAQLGAELIHRVNVARHSVVAIVSA